MKIPALFYLSVMLLSFTHCFMTKKTSGHKREVQTSSVHKNDSLYRRGLPNLIDLTKDRERIIEVLRMHRSPDSLMEHLASSEEFEMHYLVFPLRVGIVVQPKNPKYIGNKSIQSSIDILNSGLTDSWVQFKIVRIDTIYSDLTVKTLKKNDYQNYYEFSAQYDIPTVTSLYFFDNDENLCEDFSCSRTSGFSNILETITNNVVIDKFFHNDRKVVVHEFGHYFGLYHTAETAFGMEKIDGSNCGTAGDKVCDTPADPGELYNVYVNYTTCKMAGFKEELTGLEYTPFVNNYMSYYYPCYMQKFMFTPGQLDVVFRAAIWFRYNQIIELGEVPLSPWGM